MKADHWYRMSELFQQAIDQPPEERNTFLHQACGAEPQLWQAVQSLLAADEEAGNFMEDPVWLAPARDGTRS